MLSGRGAAAVGGGRPSPAPPPPVGGHAGRLEQHRRAGDGRGQFVVAAMVNGRRSTSWSTPAPRTSCWRPPTRRGWASAPAQLRYTGTAATANGTVGLAPVTLRELRIGQLSRRGVAAVVNEAPMGISLLGMSFLGGLEGWEAKGDRLMLYW